MADLKSDSQGFLVGKGGKDALELILDNTEQTLKEVKKDVRAAKRAATVKHSLTVKQTPVKTVKPINAAKTEKLNLDRANLRDAQGRFIKQQALETSNFRQAQAKATMIHQGQMKELIEAVSKGNKGSSSGIMSKLGALGLGLKALTSGRALGTLAKGAGGLLAGGGLKKAGNLSKILKIGGIGAALSALGMLSGISSVENSNMSRGMKNYTHFKNGAGGLGGLGGMLGGAAIGQALIPIPVIGALIGGLAGGMLGTKASEAAIDAIDRRFPSNTAERMFSSWKGFTDVATAGVSTFWKENAPTSWQGFVTSATGFASSAFTNISKSFEGVVSNIGKMFSDITSNVGNTIKNSAIGQAASKVGNALGNAYTAVANSPVGVAIGDLTQGAIQKIAGTEGKIQGGRTSATLEERKALQKEMQSKGMIKWGESVSGGVAQAGTMHMAMDAMKVLGNDAKYISALDDGFHRNRAKNTGKGKGSKHIGGYAFDITNKSRSNAAAAKQSMDLYNYYTSLGLSGRVDTMVNGRWKRTGNGNDFYILDEYNKPSKHASGKHIHVELSPQGNVKVIQKKTGGTAAGTSVSSDSLAGQAISVANATGNFIKGGFQTLTGVKTSKKSPTSQLQTAQRQQAANELAQRYKAGSIGGLSESDSAAVAVLTAATESGINYSARNKYGYTGAYQFGAAALEDLGYLKKGSAKKYGNKALNYAANWNHGLNKEKFMADKNLQDKAFADYSNLNLKRLRALGVPAHMLDSPEEIISALKGAHLVGAGGHAKAMKTGRIVKDANGMSSFKYGGDAAREFAPFSAIVRGIRSYNPSDVAVKTPAINALGVQAQNGQYSLDTNIARRPTQYVSQPSIGRSTSGGNAPFRNH